MPETRFSDYLSFLQGFCASGAPYFLEGGQAVNFWAEYFNARGAGESLQRFQMLERSLVIQGIRVIDPTFLLQSKCHCLLGLDQTDRQDEKHLRMLCVLVPAHLNGLLDEAIAGHLTQRALINELKLLKKVLKTNRVRRSLKRIGSNPDDLVPVGKLTQSGLTKVVHFAETAYLTKE